MPQLDLDLLEDFLFVAFAGLLLGVGDEETEERVIQRAAEAQYQVVAFFILVSYVDVL